MDWQDRSQGAALGVLLTLPHFDAQLRRAHIALRSSRTVSPSHAALRRSASRTPKHRQKNKERNNRAGCNCRKKWLFFGIWMLTRCVETDSSWKGATLIIYHYITILSFPQSLGPPCWWSVAAVDGCGRRGSPPRHTTPRLGEVINQVLGPPSALKPFPPFTFHPPKPHHPVTAFLALVFTTSSSFCLPRFPPQPPVDGVSLSSHFAAQGDAGVQNRLADRSKWRLHNENIYESSFGFSLAALSLSLFLSLYVSQCFGCVFYFIFLLKFMWPWTVDSLFFGEMWQWRW